MVGVTANSTIERKDLWTRTGILVIAGIALLCLTGCVSGSMDVLSAVKVDRTGTTDTVPQSPVTTDSISDETTVRDAVSSVDLTIAQGRPQPWANAATGSAGVIDTIVENTNSGGVCRQFHTTRHAYDGVSNYYGKTCLLSNGNWQLLSFHPFG
jgi:hypothetical protein